MRSLFSNAISGENTTITPTNLKPADACRRYARGHNSLMSDARAAGAVIRIGRSVLINVPKMDSYYASLAGED